MSCAVCFLSTQKSAESAINSFANIANCNWPMPWKFLITRMNLLTLNCIKFQKRDYHKCRLLREKVTIQKWPVCKIKLEAWAPLLAMTYAAQIVRNEVISCKKLTKLSEIASIFVNSLITVTLTANVVKLFGKQWMNFKSMLFLIALSLVVTFATMKISKRWLELNSLNTSNMIARK